MNDLKPLKWYSVHIGAVRADTIIGRYLVQNDYWWRSKDTTGTACGTMEAGKLAAWKDYQATIESAFEPTGEKA